MLTMNFVGSSKDSAIKYLLLLKEDEKDWELFLAREYIFEETRYLVMYQCRSNSASYGPTLKNS